MVRGVRGFASWVALTLGVAVAATAQTAGQTRVAAELLEVMQMDEAIRTSTMLSVEMQVESNPALAPFRDVMSEFIGKYLTWDAMKADLTPLYAQTFTEAELSELVAFYRTPTGQKTIQLLPELTRKGAEIGGRLRERHAPELQRMIQARMQELQQGPELK